MLLGYCTVNEVEESSPCPTPAFRHPPSGNGLQMDKILADARLLVNRLKAHDVTADGLVAQSQGLHKRVEAMKQVLSTSYSNHVCLVMPV